MTNDSSIAFISRTVPAIADRLTGGRESYPLFLCTLLIEAFRTMKIHAQIYYGRAAWVEVTREHRPRWTGAWNQFHFWIQTGSNEIVDFTVGVAHRDNALVSAPNLFSVDTPRFYIYRAEGLAEAGPESKIQEDWLRRGKELIQRAYAEWTASGSLAGDFISEPLILSDRRLLDDPDGNFKIFDRAIGVHGIPSPPPIA